MKKSLVALLMVLSLVSMAFAQAGNRGGSDGLHQYNAYTLGKWGIRMGASGFGTFDSYAYSGDRYYDVYDNDNIGITGGGGRFKVGAFAPSMEVVPYLAFGLSQFLDVGVYLPYYGDLAASVGALLGKPNGAGEAELWASGFGDLSIWTKIRTELIPEDALLAMAFYLELEIPTGEKGYGMRVRHPWYINPDGYSDPFSAGQLVAIPMMIATLDFDKKGYAPLRWNNYLGMALATGYGANTLIWGSGLNLLPKTLILDNFFAQKYFVELHGETRFQKTNLPRMPIDLDPITTSIGFTFSHDNILDITLGLDASFKAFAYVFAGYNRNSSHEYKIYRKSGYYGERVTSQYNISSTPYYGGHVNVSIHFDGAKQPDPECCDCPDDHDFDGVPDRDDACPNGPVGVVVDSIGCPFDSDGDKVYDYKDRCPNTPMGVTVDVDGCPLDFDKDGVFDVFDLCPNTPEGIQVDSLGCPPDADGDLVPDYRDKCPNTPEGVIVDSLGCPPDTDKDGVYDYKDWCPNTPLGVQVDTVGCPLDTDKDGVLDYKDQCPDTPLGDKVDKVGCSIRVTKKLNLLKKGILFKTGSAKLARSSYRVLDTLATLLREEATLNLEIQGHTDSVGRDESNQKLSENRANSAMNYLLTKDIEAQRLRAAGYGETKPIADNGTKEGRQMNRRVELVPFATKAPSDSSAVEYEIAPEMQFATPPEADEQ